MDAQAEVALNTSVIRIYKNGRVERLMGEDVVDPAGADRDTGVNYKDVVVDREVNVRARLFIPDNIGEGEKVPVLLYYHGGGFCTFSPFCLAYTRFLISVVAKAKVIAVSVAYRLAPEYPLPVAYDDSFLALNWVFSNGVKEEEWLEKHGDLKRVFLAGDSAGGNIVHHMLFRASGMGIKGAAMIHPWFWSTEPVEHEKRDGQGTKILDSLWKLACPETTGFDDPLINPIAKGAPSLEGLACEKLLVMLAEFDMLRFMGNEYCKGVNECGWRGKLEIFESLGEGHVFHLFNLASEKAVALLERLADFLNEE